MLQSNVDSGVLPEMPPTITSRLEQDESYCSELLKQVRQRPFPPRFILKMLIILPRQARDKHRERKLNSELFRAAGNVQEVRGDCRVGAAGDPL